MKTRLLALLLLVLGATAVFAQPSYQIRKSGSANVRGNSITYTIVVQNDGDTGDATLTDPLPAGTTFLSLTSPAGWSCTTPAVGANGTVTCTNPAFATGSVDTFTLVVDTSALAADAMVTNTATITGTGAAARSDTSTIALDGADLRVTKSGGGTTSAGASIAYTITVVNGGPTDSAVTLTDPLPAGTTFTSLAAPPGWSCTTPAVGTNGTVQCSIGVMAFEESAVFTLTVGVNAGAQPGDTFTNTATVSGPLTDPDHSNNSASAGALIPGSGQGDLYVTKSAPATAEPGSTFAYSIFVGNASADEITGVTLFDALPAGTTFQSIAQPAGWSCTTPAAGTNGDVECSAATLAANDIAAFTITVRIDNSVPAGTVLTNTAEVGTESQQNDTGNDTSTVTTTVVNVPSVGVAIADTPDPVTAGQDLTYTVSVTDDSAGAASDLELTFTPPPSTTFVSLTAPAGWSCTTPAVGASGAITCTIATFPAGGSASFTVVQHVPSSAADASTLTATAAIAHSGPDADPSDDTDLTTTDVVTQATFTVTKSAPSTVNAGNDLSYAISVTNNGPSDAGVTLTDDIQAPATFVSLSAPAGWTCTTPAVGTSGAVNCSIASMPAAASAPFTLIVNIPTGTATGTVLTNTATAGTGSATATTTVVDVPVPQADVHVTKTGPATAVENSTVAYTITVTNDGPDAATNVTLTDNLTAPFVSINAPAGWTCTTPAVGATGTVTCSIASLANAAVATFTLSVTAPPAPASLTNTANVTSTTADNDGADNASTAATTITAAPAPAGPAVPTLSPALLALLAMVLAAIALRR